jgi:hypothetical protein
MGVTVGVGVGVSVGTAVGVGVGVPEGGVPKATSINCVGSRWRNVSTTTSFALRVRKYG